MQKFQLEIIALSHSVSANQTFAIVLGEVNGMRKLPIIIGAFEAQAIAVALERVYSARPLTHDLIKNIILEFGAELLEVIIYRLSEGIFYSKLILQKEKEIIELDSRTSDALALAVRFNSPIYTYDNILDIAGKYTNDNKEEIPDIEQLLEDINDTDDLTHYSKEELEEKLEEALDQEDYAAAAIIRDELNNRQNKS